MSGPIETAELGQVGVVEFAQYEGWRVLQDVSLVLAHRTAESAVEFRWNHSWNGRGVQVVGWRTNGGFGNSRADAGALVVNDSRLSGEAVDHGLAAGSLCYYRFELRRPATIFDRALQYVRCLDLQGVWLYGAGIQFQCRILTDECEAISRAERMIKRGELSKQRLKLERELQDLVSPEYSFEQELRSREIAGKYAVRLRAIEVASLRQALIRRRELLAELSEDVDAGRVSAEEAEILQDHIDLICQRDPTRA